MAKKKQHIKVYTNADKALYQIAYITGGFTKAQAKELGVNADRLKQHTRQGHIEIIRDYKPRKGKSEYIYSLTKSGRDKCRELTNVNNAYKRATDRHDQALRQELIAAYKEKNISEWITEKDWSSRLEEKISQMRVSEAKRDRLEAERLQDLWDAGKLSPPDSGYITTEGEVVALEVITRFYKTEEIEAKHEFVRTLGVEYKEININ